MPEPMISPASKLFVMGRRTALVQASRIGLAAKQAVTKPIVKALVKRRAAKVATKKAAEAKARAQQRARAEREERRKMLEQTKKKAGTSKKPVIKEKNADVKKLLGQAIKYGNAAGQETRNRMDKKVRARTIDAK